MKKNNELRLILVRQLTAYIYFFMALSFLFYLSISIPVAWLIFFEPNFMDIIAIGLIFPGLAALVSCEIKYKELKSEGKFSVLKYFLEGYKKNFKDTIKYCFVLAIIIFAVIFNINHYGSEMPTFMIVALAVLITLSSLIATYMMIIAAKFQFKTKDLFKIGIYCILMHFKKTVKIFVVYVILFFASPWLGAFSMLLFISPIIYLVIHFASPVLEDVQEMFVEKSE